MTKLSGILGLVDEKLKSYRGAHDFHNLSKQETEEIEAFYSCSNVHVWGPVIDKCSSTESEERYTLGIFNKECYGGNQNA